MGESESNGARGGNGPGTGVWALPNTNKRCWMPDARCWMAFGRGAEHDGGRRVFGMVFF
jgi:hypothetical protein